MKKETIIAKTMGEFKESKLRSSSGDKVTDRDQAIAIALSKSGQSKFAGGGYIVQWDPEKKKTIIRTKKEADDFVEVLKKNGHTLIEVYKKGEESKAPASPAGSDDIADAIAGAKALLKFASASDKTEIETFIKGLEILKKMSGESKPKAPLLKSIAKAQSEKRDYLKEAKEYFIDAGFIEEMNTSDRFYVNELIKSINTPHRTMNEIDAEKYFIKNEMVDQLTTDKKFYVEKLIENSKKKPAKTALAKSEPAKDKFVSTPIKEGQVYTDTPRAKPGYYNTRIIKSISGKFATVQVVDVFNGRNNLYGEPYSESVEYIQTIVDKAAKEQYDKDQKEKDLIESILKEIEFDNFNGGNLNSLNYQRSLAQELYNLKIYANKTFSTSNTTQGAGYYGGTKMYSSSRGAAIELSFNNIYRGSYYEGSRPYFVSIQIGGALPFESSSALRKVAKKILEKYTYDSDYGKSQVLDYFGTSYSSVLLTSPEKNNQYRIIPYFNSDWESVAKALATKPASKTKTNKTPSEKKSSEKKIKNYNEFKAAITELANQTNSPAEFKTELFKMYGPDSDENLIPTYFTNVRRDIYAIPDQEWIKGAGNLAVSFPQVNWENAYSILKKPKQESVAKDKKPASSVEPKKSPAPILTPDEIKKSIIDYVAKNSWFELDNEEDTNISFITRENGDVGSESPGSKDIAEAKKLKQEILTKFKNVTIDLEVVDEWVYVNIEIKESNPSTESSKKEIDYKKIISKKLSVSEKRAEEIIDFFTYSKDRYEKYKNTDPKKYNNAFRVYATNYIRYKDSSKINHELNSAKEVFDYIQSPEFVASFYANANPINTVHIGLYGWDSLTLKLDKDNFPYKPDEETDYYADRTITLSAYPFARVNINNESDFTKKLEKIISDFITSYKIYVLNETKFESGGSIRKMGLYDAVLYNDKQYSISEKNGVIGLKNLSPGAWGSDYPFIRLNEVDMNEVTDMYGNKVEISNKFEAGGVIGQEIIFDDNGEENKGVIKDIHEITGDYIVTTEDGRTVLASKDLDVISLGAMRKKPVEIARKRFGFFKDGGSVESDIRLGEKYLYVPLNSPYTITNKLKFGQKWILTNDKNPNETHRLNNFEIEQWIKSGKLKPVNETFATGGYVRPGYDIKTTGVYLFKSKQGEFYVVSYLFERENDTEDSLEIQSNLRTKYGSILIQNSAWKRLSDGKTIKARTSRGDLTGTLTRIDDTKNSDKYVKGDYNEYVEEYDETPEFKIVEGFDFYRNRSLYQVTDGEDYVGEWHINKSDAEKELSGLKSEFKDGGSVAGIKDGDVFMNTERGSLFQVSIKTDSTDFGNNEKYFVLKSIPTNPNELPEVLTIRDFERFLKAGFYKKQKYGNGGDVRGFDWYQMWQPNRNKAVKVGDIVLHKHSKEPYKVIELLDNQYTVAKMDGNKEIEWKTFYEDFEDHNMFVA